MKNDCKKVSLNITGPELISLAGALAMCFAKKYNNEGLNTLKIFFQAISSNISIIEFQGLNNEFDEN